MSPTRVMLRLIVSILLANLVVQLAFGQRQGAEASKTPPVTHVFVYNKPGRFAGWPANDGIWHWGNEILVGFSAGDSMERGPDRHALDRDKPGDHLLARSLDGGETWTIENPSFQEAVLGAAVGRPSKEAEPVDCPGGIDFTSPDFALTCRMTNTDSGQSRFYYSYDRGHTWKGPYKLPLFGQLGIAARTDYIVNGPHDCLLFLTASKKNNREGRVICARTTDGARTWQLIGKVGPEPEGYSIMPSSVRLSPKKLLTTIRSREGPGRPIPERKCWIEAWKSEDDGQSWSLLNRPVPDTGGGNPPRLIALADGWLCLTYGVRAAPYRICARLSSDAGRTWSNEIVLRDDGAGRGIGYVRSVQRPDGKIVTIYYFMDKKTGPEHYIGATIWEP